MDTFLNWWLPILAVAVGFALLIREDAATERREQQLAAWQRSHLVVNLPHEADPDVVSRRFDRLLAAHPELLALDAPPPAPNGDHPLDD